MGTGRSSGLHFLRDYGLGSKTGYEYSMLKAAQSKKFQFFYHKEGYEEFLESSKNPFKEGKTYVANTKNGYIITGTYWAKEAKFAVNDLLKGLGGVASLKRHNVKERLLNGAKSNEPIFYNTKNLTYSIIPVKHEAGTKVLGEKNGIKTMIKDAYKWQIEVIVRKPKKK